MKPIPTLEDASPEYQRLSGKHDELVTRRSEAEAKILQLHAALGTEQALNQHGNHVAALLTGVSFTPSPPIKDQISVLSAEVRAIDDAIRELAGEIALERTRASRMVVSEFEGERHAMASQFFQHIAAAAKIHAAYGDMRRSFHRAGVDPAGFTDFGIELFGDPGHRNGDVGVAMRAASRKGYLTEKQIPEAYQ